MDIATADSSTDVSADFVRNRDMTFDVFKFFRSPKS